MGSIRYLLQSGQGLSKQLKNGKDSNNLKRVQACKNPTQTHDLIKEIRGNEVTLRQGHLEFQTSYAKTVEMKSIREVEATILSHCVEE